MRWFTKGNDNMSTPPQSVPYEPTGRLSQQTVKVAHPGSDASSEWLDNPRQT